MKARVIRGRLMCMICMMRRRGGKERKGGRGVGGGGGGGSGLWEQGGGGEGRNGGGGGGERGGKKLEAGGAGDGGSRAWGVWCVIFRSYSAFFTLMLSDRFPAGLDIHSAKVSASTVAYGESV